MWSGDDGKEIVILFGGLFAVGASIFIGGLYLLYIISPLLFIIGFVSLIIFGIIGSLHDIYEYNESNERSKKYQEMYKKIDARKKEIKAFYSRPHPELMNREELYYELKEEMEKELSKNDRG